MESQKINHLFRGEVSFLSLPIIESFLKNFDRPMHFIIYFEDVHNEDIYVNLFKKYSYNDYELWQCSEPSLLQKMWYFSFFAMHPLISRNLSWNKNINIVLLYNIYYKLKGNIILHHELYSSIVHVLNYMYIKKVWVCWGGIPQLSSKTSLLKITISGQINKFMKDANMVLCLTTSDRKKIENDFKIKSALFCPYLSNLTYQYDPQKKKDNKILVGNSKWYIDSYIEIARILSRYRDLDITFLCAYGYDEKYENKKQEIRELLKNNTVTFWEDKVSKEVYMMRLKSFSVYVCSVMRQTGLGACNASILSGSKLYLAGINLEHYRELGINVFNYKELANYTKSEEIFEYTDVIRNENFIQLQKTYCKEMFVKRYSEVFDRLLK